MTRKERRKQYHDYRCRKLNHKGRKKFRVHKFLKQNDNNLQNRVQKNSPEVFSFLENTDETITFFDDIIEDIKRKSKYGKMYFINSSGVKKVTVDVLIYLIVIMQNIKINQYMQYRFGGNIPDNLEAAKVYLESGFTDYVSSKIKQLPKNNDKRKIISDKRSNPVIASDYCKFVMEELQIEMKDTQSIQKILIELMSNVYHHAYKKDNDDIMSKRWYLYAESVDNIVRFIFVDTGVGIAKTVKKKFNEKMLEIFGSNIIKDSDLIASTLAGDFRTETQAPNRGNGLPGVYEMVQLEPFTYFSIISGRGKCEITRDGNMHKQEYIRPVCGTIFVFEVERKVI